VPLDYDTIKNWRFEPVRHELTSHEVILHALAVGYGHDPVDRRQLRFVYEEGLIAAPSLAVTLALPGFWMRYPAAGIAWRQVVDVEQRLLITSPLPVSGTVTGRARIRAVVDEGPERGASVYEERQLADKVGRPFATLETTILCRGDGGLAKSDEPPAPPAPFPAGPPYAVVDMPTMPQAALLFRLTGDANPVHVDPDVAYAAGFARPPLHGLCTFGIACHAIVRSWLDYDPAPLRSVYARFSAPVFPGETIRTEMWRADGLVRFRARALERDVVILSDGAAALAPTH
jgi:acyl dehydratase